MKKREWKARAKSAEAERENVQRGIAECWDALRADGCKECGRLPDVLARWLASMRSNYDTRVKDCHTLEAARKVDADVIRTIGLSHDEAVARAEKAEAERHAACLTIERLEETIARLEREIAETVAAFHDASRLRSEIQQARIKAENERDEARKERDYALEAVAHAEAHVGAMNKDLRESSALASSLREQNAKLYAERDELRAWRDRAAQPASTPPTHGAAPSVCKMCNGVGYTETQSQDGSRVLEAQDCPACNSELRTPGAPERVWCWPSALLPSHKGWESRVGSWSEDRGSVSPYAVRDKQPRLFVDFDVATRERDAAVTAERERCMAAVSGLVKVKDLSGETYQNWRCYIAELEMYSPNYRASEVEHVRNRLIAAIRAAIEGKP